MPILVKKKKKIRNWNGTYYQDKKQSNKDYRISLLFLFFLAFGVLIVVRMFNLQIMNHDYYIALASGQHEIFQQLYPERGTIYYQDKQGILVRNDDDLYPVALNKQMNLLYCVPSEVEDPEAVLEALKEVFEYEEMVERRVAKEEQLSEGEEVQVEVNEIEMTEEQLEEIKTKEQMQEIISDWKYKLSKENDPYEPLKHFVTDKERELLEDYNLQGIHFTKEKTRYYPEKNIGSHLIGFVGKQQENNMLRGYYGIEGCYNKDLSGEAGFLRSELDSKGRLIPVAGKDFRGAQDGNDLYLTIDKSIQFFVCDELARAVDYYEADKGSVIVMEPTTGKILANCNFPDYDPNKYSEVDDLGLFNNYALSDNYEPGSVFKPITMAAALDSGVVDPFSVYNDTGVVKLAGYEIMNSDLEAHGYQTMTQVLEKSLNTGTIYAASKTGKEKFREYVHNFGFGELTDIDMCSEGKGNVSSLDKRGEIYLATASFGQGITVTPLQLVRAFSAIANDGKLLEPYVIEKIVDVNDEVVMQREAKVVTQVISSSTAQNLGSMLVSVVKNGHGGKAGVEGYLIAGKTGTAQVPDFEKGGYSDKTIHTFAGFGPFENPRFTAIVKLDNVKKVPYSSDSATPVFGKIAKFILDYYQVAPSEDY